MLDFQGVRKAVFPVGGLGTRFLPATKAMPKEMLPIVDKPLIQYAVEEAISAGITQLIFITGRHKRAIEDHFDRAPELEAELAKREKLAVLSSIKEMSPPGVSFIYVRQTEPLGLGHAVLCAESVVGNEPFAVLLADDLIHSETPVLGQLMSARQARQGGSFLAVQQVLPEETSQYGIVGLKDPRALTARVSALIEKPPAAQAPSNLAVVGRYILEPSVFSHLRHIPRGQGGEIQLTDALACMLEEQSGVWAQTYEGIRFDCGAHLGFLKANMHFARLRGYTL